MISLWMLYAITISVLFGAGAFVSERALRWYRLPTRGVWAVAIGASLLLPLLAFLRPAPVSETAIVGPVVESRGELVSPLGPLAFPEPSSFLVPGAADWVRFDGPVTVLWMVASGLLIGLLSLSVFWIRSRRRGWSEREIEGRRVLLSRDVGPAVVGLRRPAIVLPGWALKLEARALGLILAHEEEHLAARDTALLCAALFAVVLAPWNLPLWWHFHRLRVAVECDCDRRVLDRGIHWPEYGALLLEVGRHARRVGLPAAALAESPTLLERRLTMMNSIIPPHRRARTVLALAGGVFILALACETPVPTEGDPADGTAAEEIQPSPLAPLAEKLTLLAESVREEVAREPVFVPHTVSPEVQNRQEVERALVREYPSTLRDAGIGGAVNVHMFVDENGVVQNRQVDRSSGHQALDEAALKVAEIFRFTPAMNHDERVGVWISVPIRFMTTGDSADAPPPPTDAEAGAAASTLSTATDGEPTVFVDGVPQGRQGERRTVRIRGEDGVTLGTTTDGDGPLIIIDGTIVDRREGTHPGNLDLDDLDPDEIERIEVLKGAAAATLYGERGADGVILITTKMPGAS